MHCMELHFESRRGRLQTEPGQSELDHARHCLTTQHVTRVELLHDVVFVKHVISGLNSTGKQEAKTVVGCDDRLAASVQLRTTKRTSSDVKSFHDKDY